jgi:VIT1/CCC1 family predicted Fe2+/Mn2+ transporter
MIMLPVSARRRNKPTTGFLESLIDPIDWLSETTFSILIFLTFTLAFWLLGMSGNPKQDISSSEVNELLIGALGAVVAWGLIDGIMYALFSVFERGERHRLLDDVQAARTNEEAMKIIAEDMDYLLEPIVGEGERKVLYGNILAHLQGSKPRNIGLKREDLIVALGHVLVAFLAVIPSTIPFLVLQHDFALALRISIIVSFVMLFIAGYRWGRYTGANPWSTGLLLMSVAVALVVIALLLGG